MRLIFIKGFPCWSVNHVTLTSPIRYCKLYGRSGRKSLINGLPRDHRPEVNHHSLFAFVDIINKPLGLFF